MKHCFLLLLIFSLSAVTAQESTASKNVSTFTLKAPQLGGERKIWVYLPSNYIANSRKYPVLYMHDGQNLFDKKTSYSGEWRVDETLDSLQAPVIVIGIEHGNDDRLKELTPYPNAKHGGGSAETYLDFLIHTLKPHVDKTYRTKADAQHTMIMGSSLGGLVSYYALLKYPDVFSKAGVFSPSFWFSKEIYTFTKNTPKIAGDIYFMAGDSESDDMVPDLQDMVSVLKKEKPKTNRRQFTKIVKGGKHSETLWAKEFTAAYLWLMD